MPSVSDDFRAQLVKQSFVLFFISAILIVWGLFQLDQMIASYFSQPNLLIIYKYSREITNIGYSIHYFILALAAWLFSKYLKNHIKFLRGRTALNALIEYWSVFVFKALIVIGLIIQLLKICFGRQRPHLSEVFQNMIFVPFNMHWHYHSFPSGHTQVIFTMATVAYLIKPKYKYWFFSLAFLLAFTRVIIHQHFFSDFIAGAYLGYILTLWLFYFWPPKFTF